MIQIQNLQVGFSGFALENINLTVKSGEFFSLIGPTGAGKTLILESIAGLVKISGERIRIGGQDATNLPPEKREVALSTRIRPCFHILASAKTLPLVSGIIGSQVLIRTNRSII